MPNVDQLNWFPQTKLYPPQVSSEVLHRPRLVEAVYRAATTKYLTLLSAPAGAGKTTAIAAVHHHDPNLPLAWLTLDGQDNDVLTFFKVVLAAIQRCLPGCGQTLQMVLDTPAAANIEPQRLMALLINDILEQSPENLVLVLDDLHRINDSDVYQALDYLLDNLPPALHLVVTTRNDPPLQLSRLRARGELAEFRMDALRFNEAELQALFNEVLGLNLTPEDLARLQERTEGWVAGVRLLTLSLAKLVTAQQRSSLIQHLSQNQRFLFDYLLDEVLNQLEPEMREFLLQTSILTELTSTLCNAVTQRTDSAIVLDQLYRQNLFLVVNEVPKTEPFAEPTYRYHALFAQFLQRHLHQNHPRQVQAFHRRAAEAHREYAQKIYHYLQAELWPEAVEQIAAVARVELDQGFLYPATLRWIEALPPSLRDSEPWLQLAQGAIHVQQGNSEAARPYLEKALAKFEAAGHEAGEILTLVHLQARQGGLADPEIIEQTEQRLRAKPNLVTPMHRVSFHIGAAWIYEYRYQWAQVEENLLAALDITLNSDETGCFQILAHSIGPQFLFIDSGMAPVEQYARATLARFGRGEGLVQMGAYCQLAPVLFYQGRLDEASQMIQKAEKISQLLGQFAWMHFVIDSVRAAVMIARAEYEAAAHYLEQQHAELKEVDTYRTTQAGYLYLQGRALWLQGKVEPARQVWQQIPAYILIKEHRVVETMARGLMAWAEKRYDAAEAHYRQAISLQTETRHTALSSSATLGLARLYLDANRKQEALATAKATLADLARRGMPGVALQEGPNIIPLLELAAAQNVQAGFARQVLHLFGDAAKTESSAPVDKPALLSPRELEVLGHIAKGLTNREIAQRLVIAPSTVKRHTVNIYNKLAVGNRTQAVSRARELGLL